MGWPARVGRVCEVRPVVPPSTDYDGRIASAYRDGRALPPSTMDAWVDHARRHLPSEATTVLDLGAGTGRFSQALEQGLSVSVVAMEPAAGMRAEAVASLSSPRVHLIAGTAQALPLASSSVDLVWASQVLHHVADLRACALELRRVLRPMGRVLVRATLDTEEWILASYFPKMPTTGSDFRTSVTTCARWARRVSICSCMNKSARSSPLTDGRYWPGPRIVPTAFLRVWMTTTSRPASAP